MNSIRSEQDRREEGIALLISVILLLMISAIGLSALQRSRDEASFSGRARSHARNLHAAEGFLQVVERDRLNAPTQISQVDQQPLDMPEYLQDAATGDWTRGYTGSTASQAAAPIDRIAGKGSIGRTADGYNLALGMAGSGAGGVKNYYRLSVVAEDSGGGRAEIEAQYSVRDLRADRGSYR